MRKDGQTEYQVSDVLTENTRRRVCRDSNLHIYAHLWEYHALRPNLHAISHLWGSGGGTAHLILILRPWHPGAEPSETGPAPGDCGDSVSMVTDGGRSLIGPRKPLNDPSTDSDPVFMVPPVAAAVVAASIGGSSSSSKTEEGKKFSSVILKVILDQ